MTKRSKFDEWNSWDNVHETTSYSEPSHKKLRRNKIDGVFGGVCSGFGDYLGIGAGAHSKLTDMSTQTVSRQCNVKQPKNYL